MKIKVYTTTTCGACVMLKNTLGDKADTIEWINIDEHPEKKPSGMSSAPYLTIDDKWEPNSWKLINML